MTTLSNRFMDRSRRMEEFLIRFWNDLAGRIDGPMGFRFLMQPAMATFFGIRDGLRFAREKRSFLLWGGPTDPAERRAQSWATWRAINKVFILAIVLDSIYQYLVLNWFYPLEALFVALFVAVVPYLAVRFFVNYLARFGRGGARPDDTP